MHDIALVMITMDRTPRTNYLRQTLENFKRGGMFQSDRFHSLHISDTGVVVEGQQWPDDGVPAWLVIRELGHPHTAALRDRVLGGAVSTQAQARSGHLPGATAPSTPPIGEVFLYRTPVPRTACVNGASAMDAGVASGAPWVLFCEDDLDVCGDFLESVGNWLDEFADPAFKVFPFGAAYPQVKDAARRLEFSWRYPVGAFYGTQCIAMRRAEAQSLADYWRTEPEVNDTVSTSAFDLMLADWHKREFPEQPYLLASAPSFVQHIGRESVATNLAKTHTFTSWPGPFWAYRKGIVRA